MIKYIRTNLIALAAAAALCAGTEDKVMVPADPADDPAESGVLIRKEQPPKKVIRKTRTVRKAVEAPKAAAGTGKAKDASVQVNNINIYEGQAAGKGRDDSLALAKARRDSLALAESERLLAEERSRRSEMETQLLTTGLLVLDAVYFETARTEISINSKPYLNMLAKMLTKYPKLQIEVAGHTDNVGSDAYNQTLSQGRSTAVMAYLVSQAPELSGRLTARGYGESSPKAENNTAEGRKYNRRTELQVLNKEALKEYNRPGEQARGAAF